MTVVTTDPVRRPTWSERADITGAAAPPERLAAFRILLGAFVVGYLVIRLPVFLELAGRDPDSFEPVGVMDLVGRPITSPAFELLLATTILAGVAFTIGLRFRAAGLIFSLGLLGVTSMRSSWGQLLHFENLMVLFVLVVACSPAADVWSVDRSRRRDDGPPRPEPGKMSVRYGFPMRLAALIVVITYVVAGIAKLRYGGWDWITSDTLRHHVASASVRLELLGSDGSPLAGPAVRRAWIFPPLAAATVAIELLAPVALLGGRIRTVWVVAAWLLHVGVFALMLIGFPVPLFGIAFVPFFAVERPAGRLLDGFGRVVGRIRG